MIKYCKKCLFPNTKPDLYFDNNNICDACNSGENKHGLNFQSPNDNIDWEKRKTELNNLINNITNLDTKMYDCLVPVSGGKDSTWQAYAAKHILKLRVLAVTFDQFDQTQTGIHNLEILKNIGVDHFHVTLNPKIIKLLVKKGLEVVGDPYWVNHVGMFTVPISLATKFSIPLVLYGENPQFEYGGPSESRSKMVMDKRWRQEFSGMRGFREEDMVDDQISLDDLSLLKYPSDEEIHNSEVSAVFLGHFLKWNPTEHTEFIKTLGWKALKNAPKGSWSKTENCDMEYIDIREKIKFLKYGYGRATDQLNIAIRNNEINRSEALLIAKANDGQVDKINVKNFSNFLDISEDQLNSIINSYVNTSIFKMNNYGEYKEIIERY